MKKRVTIYDIAKSLNLAPASVSRAINNAPGISAQTRALVLEAAKNMNYSPNLLASNLRTGGTRVIGIVVPHVNNQFFSSVIAGIDEIAHAHKYHLLICQTYEQYEKEVEGINMLIRQNVAGIFISVSETTTEMTHLENVIEHNIPLVQFDRVSSQLNTPKIINDNESATIDTIQHLKKQGYHSIAYLSGPLNVCIFKDRFEAVKKGLELAGLPYKDEFILFDSLTRAKAKAAAMKLLTADGEKPDVIFAATDLGALGVLDAAKELRLKVPEDLGICGYSNEDYTDLTCPALTTIDQHSSMMGKESAQLFFKILADERQKGNSYFEAIVVPSRLIVRASSTRYPELQHD